MRRLDSRQQQSRHTRRHRLHCLYLARFSRLLWLRTTWDSSYSASERKLLEHALYSTYSDALRVGLGPVVRAMLDLPSCAQ
jgi:hypothetical protein